MIQKGNVSQIQTRIEIHFVENWIENTDANWVDILFRLKVCLTSNVTIVSLFEMEIGSHIEMGGGGGNWVSYP